MMAEWEQLNALTKIFYIVGLISFIGLAIMVLTGVTGIFGDILALKSELLKLCPWCM